MELSIATVNVNGIRAAYRKGMGDWVREYQPSAMLLQEVRAPEDIARELIGPDYDTVVYPCEIAGRAGVSVAVRKDVGTVESSRLGIGEDEPDVDTGRWLEVLANFGGTGVRLISTYLHSGELGSPKQEAKMAHLQRVSQYLPSLGDNLTVIAGDFNIVHTEHDIKNWKPNHNKRAGVLDEEIAFLDEWFGTGWVDVTRRLLPDEQGPYTWWSWRGKAFDNDAGWRIDYQMASPNLAQAAVSQQVHRADTYDQRFSDHAPLVVTYSL